MENNGLFIHKCDIQISLDLQVFMIHCAIVGSAMANEQVSVSRACLHFILFDNKFSVKLLINK